MYYIGVDGGGTKTLWTLFDELGESLTSITTGTCHPLQVGYDKMSEVLQIGLTTLLKKAPCPLKPEEIIICLGLAGYGQEKQVRTEMEKAVGKALEGYHWYLTNDIEIALTGALDDHDGILVIAGTGSIAMAKTQRGLFRAGGWGYIIGDEGSGYWIARQVLAAYSKMVDGRLPKTNLYNLVKEGLALENDADIISYVMVTLDKQRDAIARLAKYGARACAQADPIALEIYEKAGEELALLVNTLTSHYSSQEILASYIGGVFKAQEYLLPSLKRHLDQRVNLVAPQHTPDYGAYLLARKLKF